MSLTNIISKHSENKDLTNLYINYGNLNTQNIFNKKIEKEYCDLLLVNLVKKYKFINKSVVKYIENDKYLIKADNLSCQQLHFIDHIVNDNMLVTLYNQKPLTNIEFPCKKKYKSIVKQNITSFDIDDNILLNIIEENDSYFIQLEIKRNSYIDVSIKKFKELNTIISDIIYS